jgi:hypothetical protein
LQVFFLNKILQLFYWIQHFRYSLCYSCRWFNNQRLQFFIHTTTIYYPRKR